MVQFDVTVQPASSHLGQKQRLFRYDKTLQGLPSLGTKNKSGRVGIDQYGTKQAECISRGQIYFAQ